MQLSVKVSERDHARGDLRSRVVVVHYGDFECPFSGAAHPALREVERQLGGSMCLVFRQFPLDDIHPHALAAALAAEAAGRQGKFWEMHDRLFENQDRLSKGDLKSHAADLGLDVERFERDVADEEVERGVRASIKGGRESGVHGTPTFWINNIFHDNREGLWKPDRMVAAINAAL